MAMSIAAQAMGSPESSLKAASSARGSREHVARAGPRGEALPAAKDRGRWAVRGRD
jgi:hypothetical protein